VLEIHESALVRTDFMIWLRTRLFAMNVGLAYDNFGTGQARLQELAAAPPHFLKFDQRLVSGLDQAPLANRLQLESLLSLARKL
jgi:EAL domain-containing protein (putative c-di-GMP-specific phosphodiesterase class I)